MKYELWLDESGDFVNEHQKNERGYKGSLIGGLLIREDDVSKLNVDLHIDQERIHAMEMTAKDKREYVLPVLEYIKNANVTAMQVFFENTTYIDMNDNKELYLRMMAEGLVQLLVRLNALNDEVHIKVLIARRQSVIDSLMTPIDATEYERSLRECIRKKVEQHKIMINAESTLSYRIDVPRCNNKLVIADFICNTRLTRDSFAFRDCRDRINALYEDAILISLNEITSENYIRCCLVQNAFSDALVELFTTRDNINHEYMLNAIINKMRNIGYRIVKSQIRQFSTEVVAIVAKQDDFKRIEVFLNNIKERLITKLKNEDFSYQYLEFNLLLCLSDAYLREGDIINAKSTLDECRTSQLEMGNHLEDLFSYYQLLEKETLYYIDSFQYDKATALMEQVEKFFELCMKTITESEGTKHRFPVIFSEYYGDALCMDIYALMFKQRENSYLYDKLIKLSDIALLQYPNHEGELERHRQYRAHIELEAGYYREALKYLIQAKMYKCYDFSDDFHKNIVSEFLDSLLETEGKMSCQYYIMYYLLIVAKAVEDDTIFARRMYEVLETKKALLEKIELICIDNDYSRIELENGQEESSLEIYHPQEILYWKYAYVKDMLGESEANNYYRIASMLCERKKHYLTMRVTGLGIRADWLALKLKKDDKNGFNKLLKSTLVLCDELLEYDLEEGTIEYINELKEMYLSINGIGDKTTNLRKIAKKITY